MQKDNSNSETKVQCCDDRPMSLPSLVKLGPCTPEKALSVVPHPLKLHDKNVLNRQLLSHDYSISLKFCKSIIWHYKHDIRSAVKVQGQEVKGQGHSMTTY